MTQTIGSDASLNPNEANVTLSYTEQVTVPLSRFQEWMANAHFDGDTDAVQFLNSEQAIIDWFKGQDQPRSELWELEVIGHDSNEWRLDITVGS